MNIWSNDEIERSGRVTILLTPEEYDLLPDGTQLYSIDGDSYIKGVDQHMDEDKDTRSGHLAYGLRVRCYSEDWVKHIRAARGGE